MSLVKLKEACNQRISSFLVNQLLDRLLYALFGRD